MVQDVLFDGAVAGHGLGGWQFDEFFLHAGFGRVAVRVLSKGRKRAMVGSVFWLMLLPGIVAVRQSHLVGSNR